ncbi:MAG: hypothetical protein M1829_002630 [Trizodia sp. TS-e1964]|nr:MAG: hypothetical protein M1829_002630 [Trizodia sp. TS-e1964]
MASTQAYYYNYTSPALPIDMSTKKSPYYPTLPQTYTYGGASISPPETHSNSSSSGMHSQGASYSASASSSHYAGSSSGEHGSSMSSSVDIEELMTERLAGAFDPLPLDRSLARQAQTSGALNAKHRELLELQALAQRRLAKTRANFADGMQAAKEVKRDLEWTQKRVANLKTKVERKYPTEYNVARAQYPAPTGY